MPTSNQCTDLKNLKPRAILTREMVIEIYKMKTSSCSHTRKGPSASSLARSYNVNEKTVRDIWSARTWHDETLSLDLHRKPKPAKPTGRPLGRKDSAPRKRKFSDDAENRHEQEVNARKKDVASALNTDQNSRITPFFISDDVERIFPHDIDRGDSIFPKFSVERSLPAFCAFKSETQTKTFQAVKQSAVERFWIQSNAGIGYFGDSFGFRSARIQLDNEKRPPHFIQQHIHPNHNPIPVLPNVRMRCNEDLIYLGDGPLNVGKRGPPVALSYQPEQRPAQLFTPPPPTTTTTWIPPVPTHPPSLPSCHTPLCMTAPALWANAWGPARLAAALLPAYPPAALALPPQAWSLGLPAIPASLLLRQLPLP